MFDRVWFYCITIDIFLRVCYCIDMPTHPFGVWEFLFYRARSSESKRSPPTRSSSGAQPEHMTYTTKFLVQSFVIVPLMATTLSMNVVTTAITEAVQKAIVTEARLSPEERKLQEERVAKAAKIDAYYARYDLPLAGHGMHMVLVAEENNLDWRLLPAIAMRESTGGKFACGNNPFGFGSCKIKYQSFDESIDAVAGHIGGNNMRTARYYADKTIEAKLKAYNSVIPAYTKEIFSIMNKIETTEA